MYPKLGTPGLDICIFARFKVNCEVMPQRSFANYCKFILSRHRQLCGASKARGPKLRPMRKSVTGYFHSPFQQALTCGRGRQLAVRGPHVAGHSVFNGPRKHLRKSEISSNISRVSVEAT